MADKDTKKDFRELSEDLRATDLKKGSFLKVDIEDLSPTQFAVGTLEVESRIESINKLSKEEFKAYMKEKIAPVVIGPHEHIYIIDRHHLAYAVTKSTQKDRMYCEVKANFSHLSEAEFWAEMQKNKWVYLHDENGKLHEPNKLPLHITKLKNDPYRGMIWYLIKEGYIEKIENRPYYEFLWAEYLRTKMKLPMDDEGVKKMLSEAAKWASSPEAQHLPGAINCENSLHKLKKD